MWPADPRTTLRAPAPTGLPGLTFVGFVTVLPAATGLTAPRDRSDQSTQEALQRAASSRRTFECVCVLILKGVNILFGDSAGEKKESIGCHGR